MNKDDVQDIVIPLLGEYLGVQPIESDQDSEPPTGIHIAFNFTVPYTKDVGSPDRTYEPDADGLKMVQEEDYKMVISLTSIAPVETTGGHTAAKRESLSLAVRAADWFRFYGEIDLMLEGIAITGITDVVNRDSINEDEYRNGFDVTLRVRKRLEQNIDYFTSVEYQF